MVFIILVGAYFFAFLQIIKLLFRHAFGVLAVILVIFCAFIALVVSVILADLTEKKLRSHYKNSDV